MNKKMKAIQKAMQDKFAQARKAQDEGRSEDAAKLMDECDALQKDFELEKRLYERERAMVPDEPEGDDPGDRAPGRRFPDSLSSPSCSAGSPSPTRSAPPSRRSPASRKRMSRVPTLANGEANLMPEDVDTKIREPAPELHLRQGPGDGDPHHLPLRQL